MKLKIDNLEEVLAIAKLKQRGWKRDYDKEPWIENNDDWLAIKKAKNELANFQKNKFSFNDDGWTAKRLAKRQEESKYRKKEYKRWGKRK